ncbi:hypothetical protein RB25_25960 [Herbaspirillum rubrisubalbicans]|nr:hypothetical protein RB25_25960 [Herbaspirillum rubrisubalbicans]
MQTQLSDAMSSTVALKKQGAVASFYISEREKIQNETDPTKSVKMSIGMAAICSGKSSQMDAAVIDAINKAKASDAAE